MPEQHYLPAALLTAFMAFVLGFSALRIAYRVQDLNLEPNPTPGDRLDAWVLRFAFSCFAIMAAICCAFTVDLVDRHLDQQQLEPTHHESVPR